MEKYVVEKLSQLSFDGLYGLEMWSTYVLTTDKYFNDWRYTSDPLTNPKYVPLASLSPKIQLKENRLYEVFDYETSLMWRIRTTPQYSLKGF